jgi:hypothetical protein
VGLKEVRRQAIEDHPNATEEALNEVHMAVPLKAVLAGLIEIPLDPADLLLMAVDLVLLMAVALMAVLAGGKGLIEIPLDLADLILLMTAALMAIGLILLMAAALMAVLAGENGLIEVPLDRADLILLMAAALMAVLTGGKVLIEVPLGLADLLARANCSCRLVLKTFNRLLVDVLQFVIV